MRQKFMMIAATPGFLGVALGAFGHRPSNRPLKQTGARIPFTPPRNIISSIPLFYWQSRVGGTALLAGWACIGLAAWQSQSS